MTSVPPSAALLLKYSGRSATIGKLLVITIEIDRLLPTSLLSDFVTRLLAGSVYVLMTGEPLLIRYFTVTVAVLLFGFSMLKQVVKLLPVYPSAKYQVFCPGVRTTTIGTVTVGSSAVGAVSVRLPVSVCGVV